MAFTWKPPESHRAHTLSTSLWPGIEIVAILCATTRAEKRRTLAERETAGNSGGGAVQGGSQACDWTDSTAAVSCLLVHFN